MERFSFVTVNETISNKYASSSKTLQRAQQAAAAAARTSRHFCAGRHRRQAGGPRETSLSGEDARETERKKPTK